MNPQEFHRDVLISCQILFQVKLYIARGILQVIRKEDLDVAYANLMRRYVDSKLSFQRDRNQFNRKNLSKLSWVYDTLYRYHANHDTDDVIEPRRIDSSLVLPGSVESSKTDFFYTGTMPSKKMRFASYLYYRGVISRSMLSASLNWQKKSRPLIGQIAVKEEYLSVGDFARILLHCKEGESFGEVATRLGILRNNHLEELISIQRGYHCEIGKYFITHGILTPGEIDMYHDEMIAHNRGNMI